MTYMIDTTATPRAPKNIENIQKTHAKMFIFEAEMLENYILEPYFLTKPFLEPKWDHHTGA